MHGRTFTEALKTQFIDEWQHNLVFYVIIVHVICTICTGHHKRTKNIGVLTKFLEQFSQSSIISIEMLKVIYDFL